MPPSWPEPPRSLNRFPAATTRRSANAPPGCQPGSASSSPWPGRSCGTLRCCCWTSRPPTWRPPRPPRSMASSAARWPGARSSWPPTADRQGAASQVIALLPRGAPPPFNPPNPAPLLFAVSGSPAGSLAPLRDPARDRLIAPVLARCARCAARGRCPCGGA